MQGTHDRSTLRETRRLSSSRVALLIAAPLALFAALRLNPAWDPSWNLPFPHFYIVSYTSLVTAVTASWVLSGIGTSGGSRPVLVGAAFLSLAAIFMIHGLATPTVLMPGFNHAIGWSARISLTAASAFMALALLREPGRIGRWVVQHPGQFWMALGLAYALLLGVSFGFPDPLAALTRIQWTSAALAVVTTALFLWTGWRAWSIYGAEGGRLPYVLSFALPWLALAQISQYNAPLWNASWWLYHVLMLGAFVVTMAVLARDYEQVGQFRLLRYFTALGAILGVPLIALLSEAAVRFSGTEAVRWPMFGFSALALLGLLIALLLVVWRAQRVLDDRAAALRAEKQWRIDLSNLIVHDLKTPLTAMRMGLDIVMAGHGGEVTEAQRSRLVRVQRSTDDMLHLVNDLLDVERLEAGALPLSIERVDIPALVEESIDATRDLAEAYEVSLEARIAEDVPTLQADSALLRRVLQNLISNAIKFADRPGHVRIEAARRNGEVLIGVLDDGPGVPPGERARIFDKFAQVKGAERRGTGLGLTFCKLAVEAHGGHIWVEDAPGHGSRFAFNVPLASAPPTSPS